MRFRLAVLVIITTCLGCSSAENSRLKTGSKAMIHSQSTEYSVMPVTIRGYSSKTGQIGDQDESVDVGDTVQIVSDEETYSPNSLRQVRVKFLQGEHAGKVGTIAREHIRPIE